MDRLPDSDWAHHTDGMFMGETRRRKHLCGPGTTLMVTYGDDGFRAWCFRCVAGGWLPRPQESLAVKLARVAAGQRADAQVGAELPGPAVHADAILEWPLKARLWLYKAGLGAAEIGRLGAYYHPPTNRVVLPVLAPSGGLVYWQARSIDGRQPKYLGSPVGKRLAVPTYGEGPVAVVTEDILSAYKVGLAGCQGWCALGVRLSSAFLGALMRSGKPAAVWLDPDPAGQAGASTIIKQLRSYGIKATNVVSERDPKLHSKDEIHAIIGQSVHRLEAG